MVQWIETDAAVVVTLPNGRVLGTWFPRLNHGSVYASPLPFDTSGGMPASLRATTEQGWTNTLHRAYPSTFGR